MKKSIFIILPLILWAFAACDNDDSEWDSGNLGVNSVEGTWQRVGAYPKVLAILAATIHQLYRHSMWMIIL